MQEIGGALGMSGGAENRALVVLQNLQLSRGRHNAEVDFIVFYISMIWALGLPYLLRII